MLLIILSFLSLKITTVKNISFYLFFIFYCNQGYSQERTLIYKYKSAEGVQSFSDIQPLNTDYEHISVGCYACQVDSLVN